MGKRAAATLIIFLFTVVCAPQAEAIDGDDLAHFAIAGGLTVGAAQLCKRAVRSKSKKRQYTMEENVFCNIGAGVATWIIGMIVELNDPAIDWRDIEANTYGIGSAMLLNISFDF